MSEGSATNKLELEIADLSRQIEDKRRLLEQEKGLIIEDREAIKAVVAEKLSSLVNNETAELANEPVSNHPVSQPHVTGGDYLDQLDESTIEVVNGLVARLPELGLEKTIAFAGSMDPYHLDVFHDALVTKLYDELVNNGFLKRT